MVFYALVQPKGYIQHL